MIKFDVDKLHSSYVYINRVTQTYIYVVKGRNGEPYRPNTSTPDTHNGYAVNKVRIDPYVATQFQKNNYVKEFFEPRLASINYYGEDIVSIELQPFSRLLSGGFSKAENWQSGFSRSAIMLKSHFENKSEVDQPLFNGTEIFWCAPRSSDMFNESILDPEDGQSFRIREVSYLSISTLGITPFQKLNEQIAEAQKEASADGGDSLMEIAYQKLKVSPRSGVCLVYRPDGNSDAVEAYSPVIYWDFGRKKNSAEETSNLRALYNICSKSNRSYITLDFVVKSSQTISSIYGHEALDFYPIPELIQETGVVNFNKIDEQSRQGYTVNVPATDAIAWLLGYSYREKSIANLRSLNKMIRLALTGGIIQSNFLDNIFREGYSEKDIPRLSVDQAIKSGRKITSILEDISAA